MKRSALLVAGLLVGVASMAAAQTESEPNDSRGSANPMNAFNTTLTGGLPGSFGNTGNPFFEDFWSFSAVNGISYNFAATGGNVVFPMDIGLEIQNSAGGVLVTRDNNGDNLGENLTWVAPSTGTFYLIVYEATNIANGGASYTVNATQTSAVDDWNLY